MADVPTGYSGGGRNAGWPLYGRQFGRSTYVVPPVRKVDGRSDPAGIPRSRRTGCRILGTWLGATGARGRSCVAPTSARERGRVTAHRNTRGQRPWIAQGGLPPPARGGSPEW